MKERSALFWGLTGRTMQKDEARAFLVGGRPDRGRRHGAAHAARGAPADAPAPDGEDREVPRRDGNALALLRAVGGFQAFMRSAAAPPNAAPVARFMLYEREFPDSVAASVQSLDGVARARRERPAQAPRRCCACARMLADLEFRAREPPGPRR